MRAPSTNLLRALASGAFPCVRKHFLRQTCTSLPQSNQAVLRCPKRQLSTAPKTLYPAPKSRDRGPASTEDTQTDFGTLDVLGNTTAPATSIDMCMSDGFVLSNGLRVYDGSGLLLMGGEAFLWRPWLTSGQGIKSMVNSKGQWHCDNQAWGLLELLWPKPDLLVLGLGRHTRPISPATRAYIFSMGIRIEVLDTRNAAAQFNLLATERGVHNIAAAMVPIDH